MTQDVREGGIQVAIQYDLRYHRVSTVCFSRQVLSRFAASLHHLASIAPQEDLADKLTMCILRQLGFGKMPWRVERLGEGQVLLRNDATGNPLGKSRLVSR